MLKDGHDVNELDQAKNTALHWAAGAGHNSAVALLLEYQADMNLQNLLGDTPLHRVSGCAVLFIWVGFVERAA